ncbi:MAG: hypothetical protein ACOYOB_07185 [Myxococcota bacterium]
MPTDLAAPATTESFLEILDDLRRLSRDHLLFYRLEVGRLLLDRFFKGSAANYRDFSNAKAHAFVTFATTCADELQVFGLGERTLRHCILARVVFDTLPPPVRDSLGFSHVVELTRVSDPTMRARLALAIVDQNWTVQALQQAIEAAKSGDWYDTDPATPGTQPPPAPAPTGKLPQPGRMVAQAEKWLTQTDQWSAQWARMDASKLRPLQRKRAVQAVEALQQKLAGVLATLKG